jgi:hypothetical protein
MELPTEIWNEIVKNSTKTIDDYISEIDDELYIKKIVDKLWEKRRQLWRENKKSFSVGDIVKCDEGDLYVVVYIDYKSNTPCIKLSKVRKNENWTNLGYYIETNSYYEWKNAGRLKLFEKRTDIDIQLYTYIQSLKIGDIIKYGISQFSETGIIKTINRKSITLNDVRIPKKIVLIQ